MQIPTPGVNAGAGATRFALSLSAPFRILRAMPERTVSEVLNKPDVALEVTLRPSLFAEFTGQPKVKERLEIPVATAR